jgi:hypothetical protein
MGRSRTSDGNSVPQNSVFQSERIAMISALTYREGQPDGSDPVEMFLHVVGFLLGCMREEVGLDIVNELFLCLLDAL